VAPKPLGPGLSNANRQDQVIPELKELVDINVETNVVLGPLSQDLFVDPRPVGPVVKVVRDEWSAPSDVEGQLDQPPRLWGAAFIDVLRDSYRRAAGPSSGLRVRATSRDTTAIVGRPDAYVTTG
jgi:hypothetical protein